METTVQRRVPLIVVAGREGTEALVECLRAEGAVVYETRTPGGCLRVATAVRPDMIVLPRGFPRRLARLLQQHPTSAGAKIVWVQRPAATGDDRAPRETLAEALAALAQRVQPLPQADLAYGTVVIESASDPARQVTSRDLGGLAGQLAGKCLEPSGPAHA
jgi:hypothetical protein